MTGTRSQEALLDCLETATCSYTPQALDRLWEAVPAEMRLTCFNADTIAERYRGALGSRPQDRRPGLDLSPLPEPMRRELAWCVFRVVDRGGKIHSAKMGMLVRRVAEVIDDLGDRAPVSLTLLGAREWLRLISRAVHRRTGSLPSVSAAQHVRQQLLRCCRSLWAGYDLRPWWQRELWDPIDDPRIPVRAHEPHGRHTLYFHHISAGWLRRGVQWCCKVNLETGAWAWSTVRDRVNELAFFGAFLADRDIRPVWLADDPPRVRVLMLDFLDHLRTSRVTAKRPTNGQPLSASRIMKLMISVEQFYIFMHDYQDVAAAALAEPGWLRLGPQHTRLFRRGELPRQRRRPHEGDVINDEAFSEIMAGIGVLGDRAGDGGLGDEQAMRIAMLLARTGRRMNEICMLDRDPLLAVNTPTAGTADDPGALIARLRFQQTKIDGAPDTILVDREIVSIIRAQQAWADRFLAERAFACHRPKYLFLAAKMNRNGDRPYPTSRLRNILRRLVEQLDIRDAVTGAVVDFQRTHRFRHTKATSLLNAGVPLHVVQRYLCHLSPAMTMHYAQTLSATHEAEFLRYRKLTADAREVDVDPRDLYDMLQLDQRTDRILPNGWCLLPPRQVCTKGNACLTCDKFATDATFLPELRLQQDRTLQLIDDRQAAFCARTGTAMGEDNIWLAGRRHEQHALQAIITALEHQDTRSADGSGHPQAVRGAGTTARTDQVTRPEVKR